jgi:tRNA (cytosine49-C5)-methyltransferase
MLSFVKVDKYKPEMLGPPNSLAMDNESPGMQEEVLHEFEDGLVDDTVYDGFDYQPKTRDRKIDRNIDMGGKKHRKNPADEFISRTTQILDVSGDEARELFTAKPLKAIRTNRFGYDSDLDSFERARLLYSELDDADIEVTKLSWFEGALLFRSSDMTVVSALPSTRSGRSFIQSPASYLPVVALDAQDGDRVVDLCAAPGAKTSLIADLVEGTPGQLVANELKPRRLERMKELLRLLMIDAVDIVNYNAKHLGHHFGNAVFDKILADVECSTEAGVNFASSEPLKGWSRARVDRSAQQQRQIVRSAYDLLKPGGTLVYSTCSLAPEENEFVITSLLENRRDAIVQPIELTSEERVQPIRRWNKTKIIPEASDGVLRVRPNEYLEPFTIVRIRKPSEDPELTEMMHQALDLDRLLPKI